jgi:hypothetical protein
MWYSSRLIPFGLALLLLVAAAFKAVSLPKNPNAVSFLFAAGLVELEVTIAFWLWSGLRATACRLACLGLFSTFAIYNLTQARYGAVSCACFGPIHLSPWTALAIDGGLLIGAWIWQPRPGLGNPRPLAIGALSVPAVVFVGLGLLMPVRHSMADRGLLDVSPVNVDFGVLKKGAIAQAAIFVRNPGDLRVTIARLEPSCHCLQAAVSKTVLGPGESSEGSLRLDLGRTPSFAGDLELELTGYTETGERALFVRVIAEVL